MAIAAAFVAAVGFVVVWRVSYPFHLEVNETMVWEMADRARRGLPVYGEPALDFTPVLYPPAYIYLGAGMLGVLGSGFAPLRLISALASLGTTVLIYSAVRRRTGDRRCAFVAAGLFVASFQRSGFWLDLARVDALWVFLLLLAFSVLPKVRSGPRLAGFLVVYLMALCTKQTTLFFAPAFAWALYRTAPLGGGYRIAAFVVTQYACLAGIDVATSGWYEFYCFRVPGGHGLYPRRFEEFVLNAALPTLATLVPLLLFGCTGRLRIILRRAADPLLLFEASAVVSAVLGNMKIGGSWNHFIPLFAFNAMCSGLILARSGMFASGANLHPGMVAVLWNAPAACCLFQFVFFLHDPRSALPAPGQTQALLGLSASMATAPRPIFCGAPFHYMLLSRGESPTHLNPDAIQDLRLANMRELAASLDGQVEGLIAGGFFGTLVLYEHQYLALPSGVRDLYPSVADFPVVTFQSKKVMVVSRQR